MEEIIPICKDNVWQNLQAANLTLGYVEVEDKTPLYLTEKNGYIKINALRLGMQDETVRISLSTNDQISGDEQITIEGLDLLGERLDSIPYTLADGLIKGSLINYELNIHYSEKTESYSFQKIYMPQPVVVFEDNFENSDQWEGEWGVTNNRAYEGSTSFTDSPNGGTEYYLGERLTSETANYVNLTQARAAVLECNAIWNILARYDYAQISVQTRNSQWIPLCGNYTKAGNGYQDEFEPLYDGFRVNWIEESFSLNQFAGEEIKIQLKTSYGFFTENEGFYIDNMKVLTEENLNPVAILKRTL